MKKIARIIFVAATSICLSSCVIHRHYHEERTPKPVEVGTQEQEQDAPLGQWIKCRVCDGKGSCQRCQGTGKINGANCTSCKGTGRCSVCDGQGGHRE